MQAQLDLGVFKSYDIRGIYPTQLDDRTAELIGRGFVEYLKADTVAVGRDMRVSSQPLFEAFARGIAGQGADVIDLGLTSTDQLYFAVGKFGYPAGAMITASHNPKEYNGFKLCREAAIPLSSETGVFAIRDLVARYVGEEGRPGAQPLRAAGASPAATSPGGRVMKRDVLPEFIEHCLSFIDPKAIKPLKIVVDAGNGMAGMIVAALFKRLPIAMIPLYFELDGTFPNHPASPIEPENMVDLQRAVREHQANLGAAFDGDADRVFITDERGELVGGDMVTALVAKMLLRHHPGATILYNLICSRSVPESIVAEGGKPVRTRVGHSYIKKIMREQNAIFGGEHSGHFYFRDNYYADSGLIALLFVLELVSTTGQPLSELLRPVNTRFRSGEINSQVADMTAKLRELEAHYRDAETIDHLDGTTISYRAWWANVRPSNTEPLLRLNVEADTPELLSQKRDELLNLIRS